MEGQNKEVVGAQVEVEVSENTTGHITPEAQSTIKKEMAHQRADEVEKKKKGILETLRNAGKIFAEGMGIIDKPVSREKAEEIIKNHPTKSDLLDQLQESGNANKTEKYIEFIMKNPSNRYARYDDKKQDWVDSTNYSERGGSGTSFQ